jgi:putative ABC transport system substrate-binding protein
VKPLFINVISPKDIETAFRSAANDRANAGLVLPSPISGLHRAEFSERAMKIRLPMVYWRSDFVEAGGLMSYGTSFTDLFRRAAIYVDKILQGAKPADLPIEQPKKFELVINLKTAKQIGLTIPPNVLARADKVIR